MNYLRDTITSALDAVTPPEGDLSAVRRAGTTARRRRRAGLAAGVAFSAAAIGLTVAQLTAGPMIDKAPSQSRYLHLASFDVSKGLRAFADPDEDGLVHLGDKFFEKNDISYLDTNAVATPEGVLFFDNDQKPRLLGQDGKVVELGDGPPTPVKGARSAPKVDSVKPFAAWVEHHGTFARTVVYSLASRRVVRSRDIPCTSATCRKVMVEALDNGVAYVRTAEGTFTWQADDSFTRLGGTRLRVVDVRGKTMLWEGEAPAAQVDGWTYREAPIDADLTFDGKHVLYWSNILKPVGPGGHALRLSAGGNGLRGGSWYALDTDGSVLVATRPDNTGGPDTVAKADVFDCQVPSGSCTKVGTISTDSGDPQFIGSDSF